MEFLDAEDVRAQESLGKLYFVKAISLPFSGSHFPQGEREENVTVRQVALEDRYVSTRRSKRPGSSRPGTSDFPP